MFAKLLVPLDRSLLAEEAIGHAASLARRCNAELDLVLVHEPFPHVSPHDPLWTKAGLDHDQQYIEQIAGELTSGSHIAVTCAVIRGEPAATICLRAKNVGADLIVMTTHGRTGMSRAWLGSVADAVMRHSSHPRADATSDERRRANTGRPSRLSRTSSFHSMARRPRPRFFRPRQISRVNGADVKLLG